MRRLFYYLLPILLLSHSMVAQTNIDIQEVEVNASRSKVEFNRTARNVVVITKEDIERSPVNNINDLLEYVSGIDVRQRGGNGIQADISLRGASFEQVLVLLNGVKMSDPQTGHHGMNLPLSLLNIERIEVLYGGAARIYGPGAFAGAINIITKKSEQDEAKVELLTGQYGMQQLGVSAGFSREKHQHSVAWQQQQSNGYIRNTDHRMNTIFWQSDLALSKSHWQLNIGRNEKEFGAQNFYTARFPEQYEATTTEFASVTGEIKKGEFRIQPRLYARRHSDRFELFREGEGFYSRLPKGGFANQFGDTVLWYNGHNYHRTNVYGAELNIAYTSKWGKSSIGFDFRREEILSNVLGESLENPIAVKGEDASAFYLKEGERENRSVFLEHAYTNEKWYISAGALFNMHSKYDDEFYPGVDVAYQLSEQIRPYATVNRSFRFPTYTDLYYRLGGAIGSINLKPEESTNYEAGFKWREKASYGHLAGFRREGNDLIDWIRYDGSSITEAANLTNITLDGIELDYVMSKGGCLNKIPLLQELRVNYTYLTSSDHSKGFESNYVLDFLAHKGDLLLRFKLADQLFLDWNSSYQDRRGSYTDAQGEENKFDAVLISNIQLTAKTDKFNVALQVSNLFNESYNDIGNVRSPGRWVNASIRYRISFED